MEQRFVVLDDWTDFWGSQPAIERLRERGELTIHITPARSEDEVIQRLENATVVLANRERTQLTAQVLRAAERLELVAQTGRISPNIDAAAATERGIALVAAGGQSGSHGAVAELGLALLLALARQIPGNDRRVRAGDWVAPPTRMLGGMTLGILGLGNIGGHMAHVGQALGMDVIAWGPTLTPERAQASGVEYVSFDDLFRRVDALFVSVKLSDQTRGIVGAAQLTAMKPTSYLINIARGPIIDESALVDALERGQIGGAGLDVYDVEPLPVDHPLTRLHNVVMTPHVGWGVGRNFGLMVEHLTQAVIEYLDGDVSGVVNPAALERRGTWATKV
ncbi:MAG: D-2-hydroxyacid dehydrogenase family protein [Chloroflexi bacterium]|nr:D-2-hydroxyacid dehydrogenase family protein [Chloroflexota bacterium]